MDFDRAAFDLDSRDRGVVEIREAIWHTYDDFQEHRLVGQRALTDDQCEVIARCIVFLKSDDEYRWPAWPFYYRVLRLVISLMSFGSLTGCFDSFYDVGGEMAVWPFYSEREYRTAKDAPVYFAGSSRRGAV